MNLHFFQWMPQNENLLKKPGFPMLIFLHGMGGTGQIWRPIAAALEETFICIAPDQRGHGKSRPVPSSESLAFHPLDYARDLLSLIKNLHQTLQPSSLYLIGHSMGVRSGLATAHQILELDPELKSIFRGFVSVDIGLQGSWGGGLGVPLAKFIQELPKTFADRTSMRDHLFKYCPDPAIAQYLSAVAKKVSESPEAWAFPFDHEALIQTILQADQAPIDQWVLEIANQGIPVLALRGQNSKVWLKEDFENAKTNLANPHLFFEEWPDCGHGLPFEQRPKFIERIRDFVNLQK